MFAARAFAPRFFAPRYFAEFGAAPAPVTDVVHLVRGPARPLVAGVAQSAFGPTESA